MAITPLKNKIPKIDPTALIIDSAQVVGEVEIGPQSSVWHGAVIRGDVYYIRIGARTNVQDLCILHSLNNQFPTVLGSDVTVGHGVTLHGCKIKDRVLVGIGAIVLDGVEVESDVVIAAGSLLAPGTKVRSGVLMMGSPAKAKRELTAEERAWIMKSADNYVNYQEMYR